MSVLRAGDSPVLAATVNRTAWTRFEPACYGARVAGALRIAVIGDVHLLWDAEDVRYFNASSYDLILFVGDLAAYSHKGALAVATSIAQLRRPTLVLLGNHDGVHVGQLVAEMARREEVSAMLGAGQARRCDELSTALGGATVCGYTLHPAPGREDDLSIIAGRPHSMGGSYIAYRRHLEERFGVASIEESARRLCSLVDAAGRRLIFFAHNGPTGLGSARSDIWGCDFRKAEGDWGDEDLRVAIAHARSTEKRVLAVVAGHMHHAVRGGGRRPWQVERDGTVYVNAARVPRIFDRDGRRTHHHVALDVRNDEVVVTEVLV
jgi:uncharacterized protein (TIGR04168 family)